MSTTSPTAVPDCDLATASAFLAALDPFADGFTFQTFDDSPAKRRTLAEHRFGPLAEHAQWLSRANRDRAGIFVTINETDGKGRKAANVIRVRALFADLDGPPVDEAISRSPLAPHIIVQSSPGKAHLYWRVDGCSLPQFESAQKRIAQFFGGDPTVSDLPRVMRLPGFCHCKDEPARVRMVRP